MNSVCCSDGPRGGTAGKGNEADDELAAQFHDGIDDGDVEVDQLDRSVNER